MVKSSPEVLVVPQWEADAEHHVKDSEDDWNLHLESVQKDDLVGGQLPNGIHAKGIGRSVPAAVWGRIDHVALRAQDVSLGRRDVPRGPEYVDGLEEKTRKKLDLKKIWFDLVKRRWNVNVLKW